MWTLRLVFALGALAVAARVPANACRFLQGINLGDIKFASVVVVGRVSHYEIVLDQAARQHRKEMLAKSPNISPEVRKRLSEQEVFLSDYARFKVLVDHVLLGQASRSITVTWDNSTFGEPSRMGPGPFLIALRESSHPEPEPLTVLQSACSPPFIFDHESANAKTIRQLLSKAPKQ